MSLLRRLTSSQVHVAERALQKGDLPGAIAAMEAALGKTPEDVKARRQLADLYAKAGRFEDAVRELKVLAEAFAHEGLILKATSAYKAVLDIDPDHEAAKAALERLQANKSSALAEAALRPLDEGDVLEADDVAEIDEVVDGDDVVEEAVEELDAHDADELIVAEVSFTEDAEQEELDRSSLPELPLFSDLPWPAFEELVSDLEQWRVPPGALIVHQGEVGHSCFVIASGAVRVERDGEVLATLGAGELFGEMALLSQNPRSASVVADGPCELFELTRERVEDLMGRHPSVERVLRRFCRQRLLANALRASLFEGLDEALVREVMRAFREKRVPMGKRVVAQGDKGRGLHVVLDGELDVSREDDGQMRTVAQLGEGDVFGEMSLLFGEKTSASVTALRNTTLLVLSRQGFQGFCQRHPVMKRRLEALARRRRDETDRERALERA